MSPSRQLPVYLFALPLGQELPGQGPSLTTSLRPGLCKSRDRMSKYVRVRVRTRARACVTHCLPQARQREGSSAPGQPQGQRLRRLHPQPHCQPDTQQGLGERLLPLPESSSCRIMPSGYGHWHWGPTEQGWNPALRVPVMLSRDGSFISLSFGFQIVLRAAMVPSSGRRDES